jgi:ABC-type cobalamin transport system permease subunit
MSPQRILAGVVIVVGLVALVVGVIYFTVEAKSLPSVLGQLHGYTGHRTKRGVAAVIVGAALIVVGAGLAVYRPRARAARPL